MYNGLPTRKQVKYAQDISRRTGISLPNETTFSAYREYISKNKDAPNAPRVYVNQNCGAAKITLYVTKMPSNCGECPFWQWNECVDDEPSWGDGVSHSCPFGCSHFGCLVERPAECPLQINVTEMSSDYCGGLACQVED